jgi:hypothetical protein
MGSLSSHKALLPPIFREKFGDSFFIAKANEILEALSGEKLMRDLTYRRGVLVSDSIWITPPSNYRHVTRLHDPEDYNVEYPYIEVDGKIMLTNNIVLEEDDPDEATSFSDYALNSITVNVDGLEEDALKDYLFVITAGTLVDETAVISGNDESTGGTTKLYFAHNTTSLLDGTKVTAADLISPDYYTMLIFKGTYTDLTLIDDEIPIDNNFEKRIMYSGLMFHCYERLYGVSANKTKDWERKYKSSIQELRNEFLSKVIKTKSRIWAGLASDSDLDCDLTGDHGK